jgi:hypothetical protein
LNRLVFSKGSLHDCSTWAAMQVRGTGIDAVHLPAIADPVALQRSIQEAMGTLPPAGAPVPRHGNATRATD